MYYHSKWNGKRTKNSQAATARHCTYLYQRRGTTVKTTHTISSAVGREHRERESRVSRVGGLICSISCSLYAQLVFHATSIIQDGRQVSFGAFEHNSIIHTIIRCWCVQRETYTYTRGTERGTIKTRADFTLYTSSALSVVSYIFRKNLYECDMFDVDDIISLVPLDKNKRFSICK